MAKENKKEDKGNAGALFIPAGIFLGFGAGFAFNNLPAGMFLGFGAGFLAFAIYQILKKK
jgi:CRISPR/Cas system CSM-associated protein Csm5 (group 7 of RAMP superfamily)